MRILALLLHIDCLARVACTPAVIDNVIPGAGYGTVVELDRLFAPVRADEVVTIDMIEAWGRRASGALGWDDLLSNWRTVGKHTRGTAVTQLLRGSGGPAASNSRAATPRDLTSDGRRFGRARQ